MSVNAADPPVEAAPVAELGLTVVQRGEAVEIRHVEATGPAGRQGVRAGDRITAVEGAAIQQAADVPGAVSAALLRSGGRVRLVLANRAGRHGNFVFRIGGIGTAAHPEPAFRAPVVADDGTTSCPWCAETVRPEAKICPHCRSALHGEAAHRIALDAPMASLGASQTNGLAIASLIFGLLGSGLIALVLGLVAQNQIRNSNGRQQGAGLATTGVVLGSLALLGYVILFGVLASSS